MTPAMTCMLVISQEAASHDQTQALADIAEAIYQSQQQSVDTVNKDARQNDSATSIWMFYQQPLQMSAPHRINGYGRRNTKNGSRLLAKHSAHCQPMHVFNQHQPPATHQGPKVLMRTATAKALGKAAPRNPLPKKPPTRPPQKRSLTQESKAKKTATQKPRNKHSGSM